MIKFEIPEGVNLVMSAFEVSSKEAGEITENDAKNLVEQYLKFFVPCSPQNSRPTFEKFSLLDSSVRIGISSNTAL